MRIVRAHEESHFTTLPNSLLADSRLSYAAVGLLVWMLHLPPGYDIGGIKQLAAGKRGSLRHEGRDVIAASMRELEEAGYLTRIRRQDPVTGRWETVSEVRSRPAAVAANPQVAPGPGKPGPGKPGPGQPGPGNPGRTTKKEEQELPPPPTPSTPPAGAAVAEPDPVVVEETPEQDHHDPAETTGPAAAAVVRADVEQAEAVALVVGVPWPAGRAPNPTARARLARQVRACLDRGHAADVVRETVAGDLAGARNPVGVVVARLRELAAAEPQQLLPVQPGGGAGVRDEATQPHLYVPGSHGRCQACGRWQGAAVHPQAPRPPTARCGHGRHPVACPRCTPRNGGAAPGGPTDAGVIAPRRRCRGS